MINELKTIVSKNNYMNKNKIKVDFSTIDDVLVIDLWRPCDTCGSDRYHNESSWPTVAWHYDELKQSIIRFYKLNFYELKDMKICTCFTREII